MEPPEGNDGRIEVHQSRPTHERQARFNAGDHVRVVTTDDGITIGSWGRIEDMVAHRDYLSYTIVLQSHTYRQERRNAFRVPIERYDGVQAEIVPAAGDDPIDCRVRDLSMTGAWLELHGEPEPLAELDPAADTLFTIEITLLTSRGPIRSYARTVWSEWSEDEGFHLGIAWDQPEPEFNRDLRRFVMHKERELSQRRARGE